MLTHAQIWTALDRLAARAGLSASGLATRRQGSTYHLQQIKTDYARRACALAFN
jgi:hypothetical protein